MVSIRRKVLSAILAGYLLIVATITIVPTHVGRFRIPRPNHVNLVPLGYSFKCFLQDQTSHPHLAAFCLRNTLGNIALFMPLGFLLPLTSGRLRSLTRVLAIAFCLSFSIETIQFILRFVGNDRAVDIDDVLLNTFGACLGFVIYKLVVPATD